MTETAVTITGTAPVYVEVDYFPGNALGEFWSWVCGAPLCAHSNNHRTQAQAIEGAMIHLRSIHGAEDLEVSDHSSVE